MLNEFRLPVGLFGLLTKVQITVFTAQSFFACFRGSQEDYHEEDLNKLAAITRREHMKSNEFMGTLRY